MAPMNVKRSRFYLGELDGKLYAVCGWVSYDASTHTVEVYDPCTNKWGTCAYLMDKPHSHAGIVPQYEHYSRVLLFFNWPVCFHW